MNEENKKVISIRLIYVILFFILIVGIGIGGLQYYKEQRTLRLAKSFVVNTNENSIQLAINRANRSNITYRSDVITRTNSVLQDEKTKNIENQVNIQSSNENNQATINQEDVKEEVNLEESKYIPISEVKISQGMDLTVRTGLSREDFITLISGVRQDTSGFFEQNAGIIYDLCEEYSLNEIFFCGIISAESGWNIAQNHRNTHNYISLMLNGKLINYSSVEEGLTVAAQKLHYNYLTPGGKFYYGKTLSSVKTKFCPASSTWVSLVYGRMQQILK